jgi:uncharacterized protein (DUF1800 family)
MAMQETPRTKSFTAMAALAASAITAIILTACSASSPSDSSSTSTPGSTDAAAGTIELAASDYSLSQSAGSLTVHVTRSDGTSGAVGVSYATADGSAKAGMDYTAATGTLSWADGDSGTKTVAIPVSDATPFTGNKTLTFNLSAPTGSATLGAPTAATITIDGSGSTTTAPMAGSVALSATTYSVAQSAGTLKITVARSGGSAGAIGVNFATANGTAVAGSNYTAANGTLNWADGDTAAKTISVSISNATPFSGAKSFTIGLASASGGATLGNPKMSTVTINGSGVPVTSAVPGTVKIAAPTYSVAQTAGTVRISVSRAGGTSGAISVAFTTASGTAKAGTDFSSMSGTLTWNDGDSAAKVVSVPISDASAFSGAKSFSLILSDATGGSSLGSPAQATVTVSGSGASQGGSSSPMGQGAASRLLMQGTFGATPTDLSTASNESYDAWFSGQAAAKPSLNLPVYSGSGDWSMSWWLNSVSGTDQLRQRMAFALSQILVISGNGGPLWGHFTELAGYYDILVNNALGNYRTLLEQVTLSPGMGEFLSMMRNDKPNPATGVHADQNYAREIMQLFTVGLVKLNADGSVQTDGSGTPVPAYGQTDVDNLSNVFTGWSSPASAAGGTAETNWQYSLDNKHPMIAYEAHHDTDAKTIIGGVMVPAGGSAAADLKIALDTLFNHPNVGPFIGKQLIQRLVTSNPSPGYVQRVASVFNNNGSGVRGDLLAVAKAILTDPEATTVGGNTYGKLREPLIRLTNLWRAFSASDGGGKVDEYQILYQGVHYFGQYPMQSSSVFNFYRPDYELSGPLTVAGMTVPEFQITNEDTLVETANWLEIQSYQYIDGAGNKYFGPNNSSGGSQGYPSSTSVYLHTGPWESLAANPANLIDQMNVVFMAGQMPAALRSTLIDYVSALPASPAASRVAEAAELIINSPQYAVQR